jgi:hypothetical protein
MLLLGDDQAMQSGSRIVGDHGLFCALLAIKRVLNFDPTAGQQK